MDHVNESELVSMKGEPSPPDGSSPHPDSADDVHARSAPTHISPIKGDRSQYSTENSSKLYPVTIVLYQLPVDGKADVIIYPFCNANWSSGGKGIGVTQMTIEVPRGGVMPMRSFGLNRRRLSFKTSNACDELRISLYLNSSESLIQGRVDLSTGGWARFESEIDETNVTQRGSFALMIGGA